MHQTAIRRAYAADTPAIARIVNAAWRTAYAGIVPQSYLDSLEDLSRAQRMAEGLERAPEMRYYLFEENGEPVGASCLHATNDGDLANTAEFSFFYFLPAVWRRGYGTALLRHIKREAAELGYGRLCCWVLEENRRAIAFYESQGMQRDGARHTLTVGVPLEAVRCVTDL
ncbi:MAG: GNAT family N-acetyltransferase [Clostridiales bacterium]|nr:GNAT family N-acetyltransferase [Clostridiales bacterium]